MLLNVSLVALGGALGSSLRYLMGLAFVKATAFGFPMGVLPVNIIGSFLMGVFVVFAHQKGLSTANLFVMTGVLGGFTTFSAFSLDTLRLLEDGRVSAAIIYVMVSVLGAVIACGAGLMLARSFTT